MSQKQNALAMQGRGRPSLCRGTWRSQPAQAHCAYVGKHGMNLFATVQMAKELHTWKTAVPAPCISLPSALQCNCPVFLIWQQEQDLALKNWLHREYDVHMPNNNLPSSQGCLSLMNSDVWQAELLPMLFALWEGNIFYCGLFKALNTLLD